MTFRHRRFPQSMLAFATTLVFALSFLLSLLPQRTFAVSVQSTRLPHPFQFTENKGQWDSAVLYKCEVRRDGFTWFLERDGVTLVTSVIDSSKTIDASRGGSPRTPASGNDVAAVGAYGIRPDHESFPLKSHALKFKFVDSRRGEPQSARRRQSHSPLSVQDALTCRCEERSEGSSAAGGKPQRSDEATYSLNESKTQEEITFGEPFGVASSFHFGSASHVPSFIPRKYKIRIQDTRLGRMRFAPTEKYSTQEEVGINSDLPFAQAKWIDTQGELSWHNNYFLGNDSSKWASDCRNFTRVVYHDVWEGIDVEWYESKGHLEFDFVVHPGADPKQIKMVCEGLEGDILFRRSGFNLTSLNTNSQMVRINSDLQLQDELSLPTSLGELRMSIPGAYQTTANGARGNAVTAQFTIVAENLFAIDMPNGYDPTLTLRIDPLVYSTYIGSSGSDDIRGIIVNNDNTCIATGIIMGDPQNFPVTAGAFDTTLNGSDDCYVLKLNSNGTRIVFCTIIGGNSIDNSWGISSDGNNGAIITGVTYSSNFPSTNGIRLWGGSDFFLTRINNTGSRLIYSTFFGGSDWDYAYGLMADGTGGAIVCGLTSSVDFPIINEGFDTSYNGNCDGFITQINSSATDFTVSTYIGGSSYDGIYSIFRDDHSIIVTGETSSNDYPVTSSAFDTSYNRISNDTMDCFVSRFDLAGDHLLASSFLGGNGNDIGYSVISDHNGNPFVAGFTTSPSFPVTSGAMDTSYSDFSGFITKFDTTLHALEFSTFLCGAGGTSIVNDQRDGLFITGGAVSSFVTTEGSFQPNYNGGIRDCFIAHLDSTGSRMIYTSFLGGSSTDGGTSIAYLGNGNLVIGGLTSSNNFPVSSSAFDTSYNGGTRDAFISYLHFDTLEVLPISNILPSYYRLEQNYPNPFNSTTSLSYTLPISSHVDLRLYDLMGREVTTLVQREQIAGTYRVLLDGSHLASGTYFVRLQAGAFSKTQKIVLLK